MVSTDPRYLALRAAVNDVAALCTSDQTYMAVNLHRAIAGLDELLREMNAKHHDLVLNFDRVAKRGGKALSELREITRALDDQCLWSDPDWMDACAKEIDCQPGCDFSWWEHDTNASGCTRLDKGGFCPFVVAQTLRELARVRRKFDKEQVAEGPNQDASGAGCSASGANDRG